LFQIWAKNKKKFAWEEGAFPTASPWREARVRMERKTRGGGGALIPFNSPLFVKPQHKNGMLMFLKHIY
jgi:hypothetical protein